MSAIAGIVRFSGEPLSIADLLPAAQRMNAVGIHAPQFWIQDGVGLVVRQRWMTPEDVAEQQPWVGGGGHLVLVYDGRLDNREEVAAALGISLNADIVPDGLLLLKALERWGEAALSKLIGDFALALWDRQTQQLLLARDRMGGRTLYYYQGAGFIAFASTYLALMALPNVPNKIDELGIADFLVLNPHHPENTFYQHIRRVPAAHTATFTRQGLALSSYWTARPARELRLSSDQEYVEAAREQLDRAVACRMRARTPIAAAISGGLDSSAVASTAARLQPSQTLFTTCSVPPEGAELPPENAIWYNDERPYVTQIAAQYPNMDLHLVSSTQLHPLENHSEPLFEAGGIPSRNITNIGWFMPAYQQAADAGIQVFLTGEGGNAAWSWDGLRNLTTLLRQGRWFEFARELYITGQRAPWGFNTATLLRREILQPLLPPSILRLRHPWRAQDTQPWSGYSAVHPDFAREIQLYERSRAAGHDVCFHGEADGLAQRLTMLHRIEHGRETAAMLRNLTGVEFRAPLQDSRLVEFCLAIPAAQFLKDGVPRRLPRLALADRLPASVLSKDRIGRQNPEILTRLAATRADLLTEIAQLAQIPLVVRCIDLDRLANIVQTWRTDNQEVTLVLPRTLNVARFLRWHEMSGK
ncbi:MAG: asparagine synthase-related protein [Gallionella sp.]